MRRLNSILLVFFCCTIFLSNELWAQSKYSRNREDTSKEQKIKLKSDFQSKDYEHILSKNKNPLIEDHLWYYQGLKKINSHNAQDAEKLFRHIITIHPESVWAMPARLKLAQVLVELSRYEEAIKHLDKFLKQETNRIDLFQARLLKGRALLGLKSSQTVSYFKFLAQTSSEEASLDQVTAFFDEIKKKLGVDMWAWFWQPDVQFQIAESFDESSQWDEVVSRIHKYVLTRHPSYKLKRQAEFLLAKCLARTHNYSEAMTIFENLRRSSDKDLPGLMYWMANTYAKMDNYDAAIAIREELVKRYRRSRSAVNFESKIAFLYIDQGKYHEAISKWRNVLAKRPRGKILMYAKWNLAWCYYRTGKFTQALEIYDWMLSHRAKRYNFDERVKYWKARALIESGKKNEGKNLLKQLMLDTGYYGELARRRLDSDIRTYKDFALTKAKKSSGRSLRPTIPDPESVRSISIHLARAISLDKLGLKELAARELRVLQKDALSVDPVILMELARRNNAHDVGRQIALRNFRDTLKVFPNNGKLNLYVWQQAYPEAYSNLVDTFFADSPVDEKLAWAIMKAESNFKPEVISPAGAIGLMQLIPTTARRMSGKTDGRDFDSRLLFEPSVNIELGTKYIKGVLWKMFPEDYVSVIASYNAGEEAVSRWLKNKPLREDIEIFVEEIPYSETNLYVKRVLANYWVMQRLYK